MPAAAQAMRQPKGKSRAAAAGPPPPLPPRIVLRHPAGRRRRRVKVGFAWDLFLFVPLFGLPLFRRGLTAWGAGVLGLWIADFWLHLLPPGPLRLAAGPALFGIFVLLELGLGFFGNALTARTYLARGWTVEGASDPAVRRVLARWRIPQR